MLGHDRPVGSPFGRNPLGGRNWERFATDPYLTDVAMEQTITGIQSSVQVSQSPIIILLSKVS
jgi:beta-glucosidase-like glycosyl hydrolase